MSNAHLINEVTRLRGILGKLQAENQYYQNQLNAAVSGLHSMHAGLESYRNNVNESLMQSNQRYISSTSTAENAYSLQEQIEALYPLYKNMEEADKRIRELNNKKYYDFKNYRTVRKIVQGLMDNLDFSLIRDDIIYKAVEKEHLQTPDFWLTYALLSIMAWKANDRDRATRSVEEAYKLSPKDACIFYMIMNLRLGREATALNWLSLYEQQDLRGSDYQTFLMMFSLISRTVYENVSTEVRVRIETLVNRLIGECMMMESFSEESIIDHIAGYLEETVQPGSYPCPAMQQYSPEYYEWANVLDHATNNYNILERLRKVVNARLDERNAFLKEYMDRLTDKPNDVEKDTYKEIDYNEKIILYKGDKAAAWRAYEEEQNRVEDEMNLISEMMRWIHAPEEDNVNPQMRRNMFKLMKNYEENGYLKYRNNYLTRRKRVFKIKVNDYVSDVDLERPDGESSKVSRYYHGVLHNKLEGIKNTFAYIFFAISAVVLIGGIALGNAMIGVGAFGAVAFIIAAVIKLVANKNERATLTKQCERDISVVNEMIRKMAGEYMETARLFNSLDAVGEEILDEFSKL